MTNCVYCFNVFSLVFRFESDSSKVPGSMETPENSLEKMDDGSMDGTKPYLTESLMLQVLYF